MTGCQHRQRELIGESLDVRPGGRWIGHQRFRCLLCRVVFDRIKRYVG